ncbi:unnamed protein product [Chilo suppressalis]|uniref:Cuticle protein n=1 Tax=Chilo suppressalis TaxID=168631 RepID=A0ABN8AV74_CHISP|nr:unnamed protein product [Chilo suppressalis]
MFKLVVLFSVLALAAAKPGLVAPLAYSAVPAVSSVSQYSSSVVHGSPVVPAVYGASVYSAPVVAAPAVVPAVAALSQAPHSPAVVLDAVNGVPLDTPEVVAARAAHFQAKAFAGHHLGKRSVAPVAYSAVVSPVAHSAVVSPVVSAYSAPVVSAYSAPVVSAYSSPVVSAYSAPVVSAPLAYSAVVPKALSVHPW